MSRSFTSPTRALPGSRTLAAAAVAAGLVFALAGCSSSGSDASGRAPSAGVSGSSSSSTTSVPPKAQITIASDITEGARLGLAQPITVETTGGKTQKVTVKAADGTTVPGTLDAASGTWTPTSMFKKAMQYTVTVTAKSDAGATSTASRTFTTSASGKTTTGIYIVEPYQLSEVGDAQPVVLQFSQAVPVSQRKAVQNQFRVTDTAGVEGAWRWLSPNRLDYRPKTYWPVGDKVRVTGSIQGMKIGETWGAGTLQNVGFNVVTDMKAVYDTGKRVVTVTEGGKVVRTMKADGGKKGFETVSGKMVVLGKEQSVRMRSCSVGISCTPGEPEYYDDTINNAVQITPSGTYLHAAPWDKHLGEIDSSHGCIHLSADDAAWYYSHVRAGTLVEVTGNANPVSVTNGDGDWNLTWEQWTA